MRRLILIAAVSLAVIFVASSAMRQRGRGITTAQSSPSLPQSTPPPSSLDAGWDGLSANLRRHATNPLWGRLARDAALPLGEYRSFCDREFAAITTALQLNCIANAHPEQQTDTAIVVNSQRQVLRLLNEGRYQLVGLEGNYGDSMDLRAVFEEFQAGVLAINPQEDRRALRQYFDQQMIHDFAPLEYLRQHPECRGVGIEVRPLHQLHDALIASVRSGQLVISAELNLLNHQLSCARTDMAVARMLMAARRENATRVALVIGYAHKDRVEYLYRRYGMRGQVLVAMH